MLTAGFQCVPLLSRPLTALSEIILQVSTRELLALLDHLCGIQLPTWHCQPYCLALLLLCYLQLSTTSSIGIHLDVVRRLNPVWFNSTGDPEIPATTNCRLFYTFSHTCGVNGSVCLWSAPVSLATHFLRFHSSTKDPQNRCLGGATYQITSLCIHHGLLHQPFAVCICPRW